MKLRSKLLISLIYLAYTAFAQYPLDNKRDHVWMFGYDHQPPNYGGTCINFQILPPSVSYQAQQISLDEADASICDYNGNLLFYTNAMYVANANHQIMPNGDSLNPGDLFVAFGDYGYRMPQGALILPKPNSNHLYYIFHEKLEYAPVPLGYVVVGFYYTVVDMNLAGGMGDVTAKNILLSGDSLDYGCITATRHANGRDWWIMVPVFGHNRYDRFLLCPQGVIQDSSQNIGTASYMYELGVGCFSPDGTKYVRFGGTDWNVPWRLEVFDFDRCQGTLSNYRDLWYVDSLYSVGISISPNSQFMYVIKENKIDQYNLFDSNIASTKIVVATYDGYIDPLFIGGYTDFFLSQIGPDNKIYINTRSGSRFMHVIDQPNNEGTACNVLQHCIQLNTFNANSMPNFPNFRLGPIDGSICDSLGINVVTGPDISPQLDHTFNIWPNPANDFINYQLFDNDYSKNYTLILYDQLGRQCKKWKIPGKQTYGNFDISEVPEGVYMVVLKENKGMVVGSKKLAIIR